MKHILKFSIALLSLVTALAAPARADDANADNLIRSLVPADGPDVLTFRGMQLHSIVLKTDKTPAKPLVDFDVQFSGNSTALTDQAKKLLRQHNADLAAVPAIADRIVIEGFAGGSGHPDGDLAVSQKRATAVRDYIVGEFGVDPARIEVVGRGEAEPADPQNPQSARNRRVHVAKFAK